MNDSIRGESPATGLPQEGIRMLCVEVKIEGDDVVLTDHNGHEIVRLVPHEAREVSRALHTAAMAVDHGKDW